MRVGIYRNLKKPGVVYSIVNQRTGLVVGYASDVILKDVKFDVNQNGRAKVLRLKRKFVHAYVKGTIVAITFAEPSRHPDLFESVPVGNAQELDTMANSTGPWQAVRYNPYRYSQFVRAADETPVYEAEYARLDKNGPLAVLPAEQVRFSGRAERAPSKRELVDEMLLWQG